MKKVLFTAMSLAIAVTAFTGCKKSSSQPPAPLTYQVVATGVTGETANLTEVRAYYTTDFNFTDPGTLTAGTVVAATATYADNGFTLALPLTVAEGNLKEIAQADFPDGVTLSTTINGTFAYLQGYNGTTAGGYISYATAEDAASPVIHYLVYSDKAATITGTATVEDGTEYAYTLTFVAGWNRVYFKMEEIAATEGENPVPAHNKFTYQTTAFTDVTLGWRYILLV